MPIIALLAFSLGLYRAWDAGLSHPAACLSWAIAAYVVAFLAMVVEGYERDTAREGRAQ